MGAFEVDELRTIEGLWRVLEVALTDTLGLENGIARSRTLITLVTEAAKLQQLDGVDLRLAAVELAVRPATDRAAPGEEPGLLDGDRP